MKYNLYKKLMTLCSNGCHQIPERSFFIKGKQFPICARCTGVLIGYFIAYTLFLIISLPAEYCLIGCAIMFVDWYIQFIGLCISTNVRRLFTGIIGGYSLATLYCMIIKYIVELIIKL